MNKLIKFYYNLIPANNKKNYFFDDIVSWSDYKLETAHDYIQWLFPDKTGGVNPKAPHLTPSDIKKFKTDRVLRRNVVQASLRMLLFYGFVNEGTEVKQILPLNRRERGRTIGLFSTHNYRRLTRIMSFLRKINMEYLSAIFFLSLCYAMRSNHMFLKKVLKQKSLPLWMKTQKSLKPYITNYDINKITEVIPMEEEESEDWDEWGYWDEESEESEESEGETELEKTCGVRGLDYTGNSCYMDSTLLSVFAIPNSTVTNNILRKNLGELKSVNNLWIQCNDNMKQDIKRRRAIQKALVDITNSMRGLKKVRYCSNLRSLIRQCPGTQAFHERGTQDAGEFLTYLFNLFQVDVAKTVRRTYGSNDTGPNADWKLVKRIVDRKASPIIDIVATTILDMKAKTDITTFTTQTLVADLVESERWYPDRKNAPDVSFSRRKEVIKTKSPYLVFSLHRTYGIPKFDRKGNFRRIDKVNLWKKVKAPESMRSRGQTLHLTAIVIHTGGAHYTANFKCRGEWFSYDDNPIGRRHDIQFIGSYKNMVRSESRPLTHGTLFFYT